MHFSTFLTFAFIIVASLASPLVYRQNSDDFIGGPEVPKTGNSATCKFSINPLFRRFDISVDSVQNGGLCDGLLANLKGICGAGITAYSCETKGSVKQASFNAPLTCSPDNINGALQAATTPSFSPGCSQ
ncbi:hypothetical protein DL96DRAFT_1588191 [Flagelloscypha sp. PMI_526]|nr:hypothetical protein DL96DRAFT_1588191 [Flagelloscypha sp. PMI_526]